MADIIEISSRQKNGLMYIKYALELHEKVAIGTNDVDAMYDRIKALYPNARLTKEDGFILVENDE